MGYDLNGLNPKSSRPHPVRPAKEDGTLLTYDELKETTYFEEIEKWEMETPGAYFRANISYWAPLRFLSYVANQEFGIDIPNIEDWAYNDGSICEEQFCEPLADAIENLAPKLILFWDEIEDDKLFYWSNGRWENIDVPSNVSREATEEAKNALNSMYESYEFVNEPVEFEGHRYIPSYYVQKGHIKDFINFLRNCGGFSVC